MDKNKNQWLQKDEKDPVIRIRFLRTKRCATRRQITICKPCRKEYFLSRKKYVYFAKSMQHEPTRSGASHSLMRLIPNTISISRLLATPFLLATVLWHRLYEFKWLLLVCFLSDILDGAIARIFRLRSQLGAFLDSTADLLVLFIAMTGIVVFQKTFLTAHYVPLIFVFSLHLAEVSAALLRYGRISSFHTILNRIAAYAQGIFIMSLFLWGYRGWLFDATIFLMVLACTEEFVLLFLLTRWRSDVRGLYWILSERSATPP